MGFHNPPQPPIPGGMVWNMIYDVDRFNAAHPADVLPPNRRALSPATTIVTAPARPGRKRRLMAAFPKRAVHPERISGAKGGWST